MKLRDFTWWPKTWKTPDYQNVTPEQVNDDGILDTSKILHGDLMIEVDCRSRTAIGRVGKSLNAPNLERVRDFLLDHCDESMETVQDLEVTPDHFNTRLPHRR